MFIGCSAKNEINTTLQVRANKMLLVVRDPWERLLSAYRDKLEATTGPDQVDLAIKHGKRCSLALKTQQELKTRVPCKMCHQQCFLFLQIIFLEKFGRHMVSAYRSEGIARFGQDAYRFLCLFHY